MNYRFYAQQKIIEFMAFGSIQQRNEIYEIERQQKYLLGIINIFFRMKNTESSFASDFR